MPDYPLREYFIKYLTDVQKVSKSTIKHYLDALNWISRFLANKGLIIDKLFEVSDTDSLKHLSEILLADAEFVAMNKRGHQMYTAGFNHYMRFAEGTDFEMIGQKINLLDVPIPVADKTEGVLRKEWKRSGIIKDQSIKTARYECEVDSSHKTFIAARSGKPYMEGHHSIPMRFQSSFSMSLDVYANIVCLCPICHRLLHFGKKEEKLPALNKIYFERGERMAHSGIRISHDEFIDLVG